MRRPIVVIALLAIGQLLGAATAQAANPTVNHFTDSGVFTDNDFCGTGKTVNGSFAVMATEFLTPNQADVQ